MKTLIVNSYPTNEKNKIERYAELVSKFSDYEVAAENSVCEFLLSIEKYDAIVLSGSPKMISKGEYDKSYTKFLRNLNLPTLGICYGHQILAFAFGGLIEEGELINREEEIKAIEFDELFADLPETFYAYENHKEFVKKSSLAKIGFKAIAASKSCEVEAMRHLKKPLFGVQFHIERSKETGEKILANFYHKIVKK